jgi:hypothetical protein
VANTYQRSPLVATSNESRSCTLSFVEITFLCCIMNGMQQV